MLGANSRYAAVLSLVFVAALVPLPALPQDQVGSASLGLGINERREGVVEASYLRRRVSDAEVDVALRGTASASERALAASVYDPAPAPAREVSLTYRESEGGRAFPFDSDVTEASLRVWPGRADGSLVARVGVQSARVRPGPRSRSRLVAQDRGRRTRLRAALDWTPSGDDAEALRVSLEPALWLSDDTSGLLLLSAKGEARVLRTDATSLRTALEVGGAFAMNRSTRIDERFYLSPSRLRGFAAGGIGPRDLATGGAEALGGNAYATLNTDWVLRDLFGRPFPATDILPSLFLDIGTVWGLDDTGGGAAGNAPVDDGLYWRAAAGAALALDTGAGSLAASLALPLRALHYDRTETFQLSFRTRF